MKKQSAKLSSEEFDTIVEEVFATRLSDASEAELKPNGNKIKVTKENLNEYIELLL